MLVLFSRANCVWVLRSRHAVTGIISVYNTIYLLSEKWEIKPRVSPGARKTLKMEDPMVEQRIQNIVREYVDFLDDQVSERT